MMDKNIKRKELMGKREAKFEHSLETMKVKKKSYFGGGDALNGNTTKLIYNNFHDNKTHFWSVLNMTLNTTKSMKLSGIY